MLHAGFQGIWVTTSSEYYLLEFIVFYAVQPRHLVGCEFLNLTQITQGETSTLRHFKYVINRQGRVTSETCKF